MSDAVLIALIASLPGVLVGIATLLTAKRIHKDTNSNFREAVQRLDAAKAEIAQLKDDIVKAASSKAKGRSK